MVSRIDFYDLEEELLDSEKINFDISEISYKADKFFTYFNTSEYSMDTIYKLDMIRKAEFLIREMLQIILSYVNPDINPLINFDNQQNDSYRSLVTCIGLIQNKLEKQKEDLKNKLSNLENVDTNRITNKSFLDYYLSYLENLLNDMIYSPLKESIIKFNELNRIENIVTDSIRTFGDFPMEVKKDKILYFYLVFSHLFRASQVIGFLAEQNLRPVKPFEFKDLDRLVRERVKSALAKSEVPKPESPKEKSSSENSQNKNSSDDEGDGDEEDEDEETEEEIEFPLDEEELEEDK